MSAAAKKKQTLGQDATPPPRRDLGDAFGVGGRPRLAARKLGPSAPPDAQTLDADIEDGSAALQQPTNAAATDISTAPDTEQGTPNRRPATGGRPRNVLPASSAADESLTIGRVIYLTGELWELVRIARARNRQTNTQVVLEAIKATHDRLGDLVDQDVAPRVVKGDLWDEIVTPDRSHQPAKRQVNIWPTRQQLRVIDALVDQTGARDRSHLFAVALTAYLT